MSAYSVFAGIDACRGGWLMVSFSNVLFSWNANRSVSELLKNPDPKIRVLMDMPIGLADGKLLPIHPRPCDCEARKRLGRQSSSVFGPPCMEALFASGYAEACAINQNILGVKISIQSWNISPKIKELNAFLHHNAFWRNRVLEAHPELCFRFLNNGNPLLNSKKTREGTDERFALLAKAHPGAEACFQSMMKSKQLKGFALRDDMLDALVLAVHNLLRRNDLQNVAVDSPVDALGNMMALWY
jgi:predicted RNase H-like nuclease